MSVVYHMLSDKQGHPQVVSLREWETPRRCTYISLAIPVLTPFRRKPIMLHVSRDTASDDTCIVLKSRPVRFGISRLTLWSRPSEHIEVRSTPAAWVDWQGTERRGIRIRIDDGEYSVPFVVMDNSIVTG
jgi:hypothetical protein